MQFKGRQYGVRGKPVQTGANRPTQKRRRNPSAPAGPTPGELAMLRRICNEYLFLNALTGPARSNAKKLIARDLVVGSEGALYATDKGQAICRQHGWAPQRRANPGLAILNPLPAHLQTFVQEQQLSPDEVEEFNQALGKYCEFHGVSAEDVNITEIPDNVLPDVMAGAGGNRFLVAMGDTEDTSYSANTKHDYINSNKRGVPFKHEYPSKPTMATDPTGQMIFIINKPGQDKHFVVSDWIRG